LRVGVRRTLTVMVLGSALVSRPALGQQGSSVSLTHTVSVTVPPRVKVQVGNLASSGGITSSQQAVRSEGLAVSVRATQSWALSIGSTDDSSTLQWSTDRDCGFAAVGSQALIAHGEISPAPAVATVFLREGQSGGNGSDMVILTVVAP
jgi:hypothetical protein